MGFFKQLMDTLTLGSAKPIRRLLAYYLALGAVLFVLVRLVPGSQELLLGGSEAAATTDAQILQDGLSGAKDSR